jgi:hypothetical protein
MGGTADRHRGRKQPARAEDHAAVIVSYGTKPALPSAERRPVRAQSPGYRNLNPTAPTLPSFARVGLGRATDLRHRVIR